MVRPAHIGVRAGGGGGGGIADFKDHGGLTAANGQRFRDMILSRGNTEDLAKMYNAWRGQDPSIEPMLENRGLKDAPKTTGKK